MTYLLLVVFHFFDKGGWNTVLGCLLQKERLKTEKCVLVNGIDSFELDFFLTKFHKNNGF